MKTHFSFHNFDPKKCSEDLEGYVSYKKLKSLTRLLQNKDLDSADLDIRAEYMSHHNSFSVKLNLKIVKHVLFAEEVKHSLTKAFDLALTKLTAQLRRLEDIKHKKHKNG